MKMIWKSGLLLMFVAALFAFVGCEPKPVSAVESPLEKAEFSAALQQAKTDNKLVLLDFTGSDWCPPCMALHDNVLSKPDFTDYAKSNLVFVELDFPRRKPQTEEVKKANEQLAEKFHIEGFPTLVLLNAEGKELWREVGYASEKPADLITKLEKNKGSK